MKDKEKCVICHKDITKELPKIDADGNHYCKDCYIEKCKKELEAKAIEEMAMIMCENNCEECRRESIEFYGNSYDEDTQCLFNAGAERLYNAGYRKLPEDSVVLTKEEFWKLSNKFSRKELDDISQFRANKARKETAEKIFNQIIWYAVKRIGQTSNDSYYQLSFDRLSELAKQFGVEIINK